MSSTSGCRAPTTRLTVAKMLLAHANTTSRIASVSPVCAAATASSIDRRPGVGRDAFERDIGGCGTIPLGDKAPKDGSTLARRFRSLPNTGIDRILKKKNEGAAQGVILSTEPSVLVPSKIRRFAAPLREISICDFCIPDMPRRSLWYASPRPFANMSQLATARLALAILSCAGSAAACSSRSFSLGTIDTSDAGTDTATDVRVVFGPTTPWIATVPGPLHQSVHAIAVNAANQLFLGGSTEVPPQDEADLNAFASSLDASNGAQRWMQAFTSRDKGWGDNATAVIPTGNDVVVVGTYHVGAVDPLGFADVYPSSGGPPTSATTLFSGANCQPPAAPCDGPLSHHARAATLVGNTLFVVGRATERFEGALPWLVEPVPIDLHGWGFVGAMQGSTPLWGRTLGHRFIRRVTSVVASGNELYVTALGSVSATSDDADSPPLLWLMKADFAGNILQERQIQTTQSFTAPSVILTPGGLAVAAAFSGTFQAAGKTLNAAGPTDVCVLGVNPIDLSLRWATTLGGALETNEGHALAAMPDGDLVVACGSCVNPEGVSPADGEANGPGLVRLGPQGAFKGSVAWGTTGSVHIGAAIANNKGDGILVGGTFAGGLSVPSGLSATANDGEDGFVLQVFPP